MTEQTKEKTSNATKTTAKNANGLSAPSDAIAFIAKKTGLSDTQVNAVFDGLNAYYQDQFGALMKRSTS